MSTTPVTPAVKISGLQKFENILTGIGKFIQDAINVEINVAIAEKPLIDKFLPPTISAAIDTAESVALSTYLQIEAQEQTIGAGSAPYAQKVAQVLVLQGAAIAKILATAGLSSAQGDLQVLVAGATGWTQIGSNPTVLTPPVA